MFVDTLMMEHEYVTTGDNMLFNHDSYQEFTNSRIQSRLHGFIEIFLCYTMYPIG